MSGGTKPDSGETMSQHQTQRSRRRIARVVPKMINQEAETGGVQCPSIDLLLRGNALVLEVSGRWGSKFLGLLQRLPYLACIGQKLPSYKIMETFGVNWTGPLKAFVEPREAGGPTEVHFSEFRTQSGY